MTVARHLMIQSHTRSPARVQIRPTGRVDVLTASRGLTRRDAALLSYLAEHRVLTSLQVARLLFGSYARSRARLAALYDRGVLARFRRDIWPGSEPWRYTLGPVGAVVHAAATGESLPRPATVTEKTLRLANSSHTEHLLGVNDFFTNLAGWSRTHQPHNGSDGSQGTGGGDDSGEDHVADAGGVLSRWMPEHAIARTCGDIVRPDAYGEWTVHGRTVGFFYEHDTGTEPLDVLVGKVAKYGDLAQAGIARPVLFRLPSSTREHNLREAMTRSWPARTPVPVATTAADQVGPPTYDIAPASPCPAEAVWLPAGRHRRVRLADLHLPDTSSTEPRPETGWEAAA